MPKSYRIYPGDGATSLFGVPFEYLSKEHIRVFIDGVETQSFSFPSENAIQLPSPPATDELVRLQRTTPTEPFVDFEDGGNLIATDLDAVTLQSLFIAQESQDIADTSLREDAEGQIDALTRRIRNLAPPVAQTDAATRAYVDNGVDSGVANARDAAEVALAAQVAAEAAAARVGIPLANAIALRAEGANALREDETSALRVHQQWSSFRALQASGVLATGYPGDYDPDTSPLADTHPQAMANLAVVIRRVEQFAALQWEPVADMVAQPVDVPVSPEHPDGVDDIHEADTPVLGPPYSSVKTFGRSIAQDISFETFVTAVRNPDSKLYSVTVNENFPAGGSTGRTFYGAVCSNFLAYGFGWSYSPTTAILNDRYEYFGFKSRLWAGDWYIDDVRLGDVLITDNGGHIELVVEVTDTTITLFDQAYDGPDRITRSKDDFYTYAADRSYGLYRFDYAALGSPTYEPSIYAPLPDETLPAPVFNDVLHIDRGNVSVYNLDEPVRFYIQATDVQTLVVERDGVAVVSTTVTGDEVVIEPFDVAGDYSAYCVMDDGPSSTSMRVHFKVCGIAASLTASSVGEDEDVSVDFVMENCTPSAVIVEDTTFNSISKGLLHYITDAERAAGRVTFSLPNADDYIVRVQGTTEYGIVYNEPHGQLPLTIT